MNPEDNLSDLESEEETGSEDESEDEIRENLEFNFGQLRSLTYFVSISVLNINIDLL